MPSLPHSFLLTILCLSSLSHALPVPQHDTVSPEVAASYVHTERDFGGDTELLRRALKSKPLPKLSPKPAAPPPAKQSTPPAKASAVSPAKPSAPPPAKTSVTPPSSSQSKPAAGSSAIASSSTASTSQAASSSASSSASSVASSSSSASSSSASSSSSSTASSSTAAPSQAANSTACPLNPPTKKPTVAKRFTDMHKRVQYKMNKLLGRVPAPGPDDEEFIGFHGTNSKTADLWESSGQIVKPPGSTGILDFLGLTSTGGTSGADAELGPGLYIADELTLSQGFANGNALGNPGTTAKVCAIFAKKLQSGEQGHPKYANIPLEAFTTLLLTHFYPQLVIPDSLVGDSSDAAKARTLESARAAYHKNLKVDPTAIRFSTLRGTTSQMLLPEKFNFQFSAKCFDANGGTLPAGAIQPGPNELFLSTTRRSEWNITPENEQEASRLSVKNCL